MADGRRSRTATQSMETSQSHFTNFSTTEPPKYQYYQRWLRKLASERKVNSKRFLVELDRIREQPASHPKEHLGFDSRRPRTADAATSFLAQQRRGGRGRRTGQHLGDATIVQHGYYSQRLALNQAKKSRLPSEESENVKYFSDVGDRLQAQIQGHEAMEAHLRRMLNHRNLDEEDENQEIAEDDKWMRSGEGGNKINDRYTTKSSTTSHMLERILATVEEERRKTAAIQLQIMHQAQVEKHSQRAAASEKQIYENLLQRERDRIKELEQNLQVLERARAQAQVRSKSLELQTRAMAEKVTELEGNLHSSREKESESHAHARSLNLQAHALTQRLHEVESELQDIDRSRLQAEARADMLAKEAEEAEQKVRNLCGKLRESEHAKAQAQSRLAFLELESKAETERIVQLEEALDAEKSSKALEVGPDATFPSQEEQAKHAVFDQDSADKSSSSRLQEMQHRVQELEERLEAIQLNRQAYYQASKHDGEGVGDSDNYIDDYDKKLYQSGNEERPRTPPTSIGEDATSSSPLIASLEAARMRLEKQLDLVLHHRLDEAVGGARGGNDTTAHEMGPPLIAEGGGENSIGGKGLVLQQVNSSIAMNTVANGDVNGKDNYRDIVVRLIDIQERVGRVREATEQRLDQMRQLTESYEKEAHQRQALQRKLMKIREAEKKIAIDIKAAYDHTERQNAKLAKEVERLKQICEKYQAKIEAFSGKQTEAAAAAQQREGALNKAIEKLRHTIAERKARIDELESKLQEAADNAIRQKQVWNSSREQQLREEEGKRLALKTKLNDVMAKCHQRCADLEERIKRAQGEADKLKSDAAAERVQMDQKLESLTKKLEEERKLRAASNASKQKESDDVQEALRALEARFSAEKEAMEDKYRRLQHETQDNEAKAVLKMEEMKKQFNDEAKQNKDAILAFESKNAKLSAKCAKLREEAGATKKLEDMEKKYAALEAEAKAARKECVSAKKHAEILLTKVAKLTGKLNAQKKKPARRHSKEMHLQEALHKASLARQKIEIQNDKLKARVRKLEKVETSLRVDVTQLRRRTQSLGSREMPSRSSIHLPGGKDSLSEDGKSLPAVRERSRTYDTQEARRMQPHRKSIATIAGKTGAAQPIKPSQENNSKK